MAHAEAEARQGRGDRAELRSPALTSGDARGSGDAPGEVKTRQRVAPSRWLRLLVPVPLMLLHAALALVVHRAARDFGLPLASANSFALLPLLLGALTELCSPLRLDAPARSPLEFVLLRALALHWVSAALASLWLPFAVASLWFGSTSTLLSVLALGWGVGAMLTVVGAVGATLAPRVMEYELVVKGLPRELDGYRVALLSDLHFGSLLSPLRTASWPRAVARANPDLIAVVGDLVTNGAAFQERAARFLCALPAPDGLVLAFGNHDRDALAGFALEFDCERVVVLNERAARIPTHRGSDLVFAGFGPRRVDVQRRLEALAAQARALGAGPLLLLDHYPEHARLASAAGFSAMLSGHTHGGQVWLATRAPSPEWPWAHGRYTVGDCTVIVGAGLGTTGPPVRLGAWPELPVLVLRSDAAPTARC